MKRQIKVSKPQIKRTYARLSRMYDFWTLLIESKAARRALELANIRDGEQILEVAAGTGVVFERIVRFNPSGRNEGVDLSPEMLAKAEKRLKKSLSNYKLQVADAYSLPFPDSTFDLIINNYMFDLMPEEDFQPVLLEFKRVLKPEGRVVTTTMTPGKRWYSRIWGWLIKRAPNLLTGCRPVSLEAEIRQAGFVNIKVEYISQLTFPSQIIYAEK